MHFATMSEWLSPAKINYACSAHYLDHVDALNLTAEQQSLLKEIPDSTFKESVRDFMVNQQFRRDYWIKGARQLSAVEQTELIKQRKLILISAREDISLKIAGSIGTANMSEAIYAPILDLMADHKSRSIESITAHVKDKGVLLSQVIQAAIVLIGSGHMASVQDDKQIFNAKETTKKLNQALLERAKFSKDTSFLASPVTGGGLAVNRFQQLFLLALSQGKKQPREWAQTAWEILAAQNQRLLKDGNAIESAQGNLEELTKQAETFSSNRLIALRALLVA
jgi:hypothetical protein